jgi:agmatine/peptidylarginine deiminase
LQYRYEPDYLRDGFEHLMSRPGDIAPIPEVESCSTSDIILDGGNVVRWGSRCIMTEKVFRENPRLARGDLLATLREALRVEDLIVIPKEPYDVVGHADGVVRFLDDGLVAINDYSAAAAWYGRRLRSILRRAGLEWVELPYRPEDAIHDGIPSAVGCYANFLMVRGLIVVPAFGLPEDDIALRVVEEHAGSSAVTSLDCSDLARGGGVLNCVTWTISVCQSSST